MQLKLYNIIFVVIYNIVFEVLINFVESIWKSSKFSFENNCLKQIVKTVGVRLMI